MADGKTSKWTWFLVIGLVVFGAVYLYLVLSGTGIAPGDSARDAVADPVETSGGTAMMDLAAWPWTAIVLIGTAVLAIVLAIAQFRTSHLSREEFNRGERAVRQAHKEHREL